MELLEFYRGKKVLVTGHTGFKGSWFVRMLTLAGAQVTGCLLYTSPVLQAYFSTGLVAKFPTLIVCSGIYVVSFLLWMSGLILDVIAKKHRQLFELYLNILSSKKEPK